METLPPEPAPLPAVPLSAHRRVLAAYDRMAETGELWTTLRPREDVLVEAKAVDVRVRADEPLPLAGLLAVVADTIGDAAAIRLLTGAGAVVLGTTPFSRLPAVLGFSDIAIGTGAPTVPDHVAGLTPTPGLVPGSGDRICVLARTVAEGQLALAAMTDRGAWPSAVRLSAGPRPRLAIPGEETRALRKAADDLLAAGASVETVAGQELPPGYDALLLPGDVSGPPGLPTVAVAGVRVIAHPFDDQIALDLAAYLTGEQVQNPYPATGIDLVVFGARLRGQPLNHELVAAGARFREQVCTARRYRMIVLPTSPPEPGVVAVPDGAALTGERWTISPDGLRALESCGLVGEVVLDDDTTAAGFRCAPDAAARDITEFGDWRAYLRYLTASRPLSG